MAHAAPTPPRGKELRVAPVVAVLVVLLLVAVVVGIRRSRSDAERTDIHHTDATALSVASTLSATSAPKTNPSLTATPSDTATASELATAGAAAPAGTPTPTVTDPATTNSPPTSTTTGAPAADQPSLSDLKKIPLVVVNNPRRSRLATRAATRLEKDGWTVRDKVRYLGSIKSSCVYYDPGDADNEAAAKALRKRYPHIDRTAERFSTLPSGPLIVVLKEDLV